jgi:hypothetical protein
MHIAAPLPMDRQTQQQLCPWGAIMWPQQAAVQGYRRQLLAAADEHWQQYLCCAATRGRASSSMQQQDCISVGTPLVDDAQMLLPGAGKLQASGSQHMPRILQKPLHAVPSRVLLLFLSSRRCWPLSICSCLAA